MALVIAGGTGFIGRAVTRFYRSKGRKVFVVTRSPREKDDISWNQIQNNGLPNSTKAVINLCGRNIGEISPSLLFNKNYQKFKKELFDSRIETTKILVDLIKSSSSRPEIFINSSAIGFYKPSLIEVYTEKSAYIDYNFITKLCKEWEEAAQIPDLPDVKQVQLRTGLVFGPDGGMLKDMYLSFYIGMGGKIGAGNQWMSWIHIDDLIGLIDFIIENKNVPSGPFNGTSPNPVTGKEFAIAFGKALYRPALLKMPAFFVKLIFKERSTLLLDGQKVIPQKALDLEYKFKYPKVLDALKAIYQ